MKIEYLGLFSDIDDPIGDNHTEANQYLTVPNAKLMGSCWRLELFLKVRRLMNRYREDYPYDLVGKVIFNCDATPVFTDTLKGTLDSPSINLKHWFKFTHDDVSTRF